MNPLPADALCGSLPPLVTPFRDQAIDTAAYDRMVRFHIARGSHGIVVCGTSGEPSALELGERKRLLETALTAADGRLPVVAAVGSQSLVETKELVGHATRMRADALLIVTPYYIRPPQRGLIEYFVELCGTTDLPVLLYHIPGRAAVTVELDTVVQIASRAENFVGMKHAVADLGFVTDVLRELGPEFRVHVGLEELSFPMLAIGAAGMINAVANVAPERVAALYEAVRDGKLEEARRLHFDLWELNRSVFFETNPIPIKYMMRKLGLLDVNEHRLPMMPASESTQQRCDQVLASAGLLESSPSVRGRSRRP